MMRLEAVAGNSCLTIRSLIVLLTICWLAEVRSKPVARHFNLRNHSNQHMVVCGLPLHQGSTESRKTLEQKIIFQIGTLNPNGINERFSFN